MATMLQEKRMHAIATPRLILASASPRRAELLSVIGLVPTVRPADVDETRRQGEPPRDYAARLAADKARALDGGPDPVLGADTIVVVDGDVLGKPASADDAQAMIDRLAGRSHQVLTAFHVVCAGRERFGVVETEVVLRPMSAAERRGYVATGEWQGKAGGYAVQGIAGAFVRSLSGSYSNVVGLPVCEVVEALAELGVLPHNWPSGAGA
jgi:septum formation protein